jgi:DNA polymerase-3 subunit alpha
MSSFTHLHVHSYYSLMDGLNSPAELMQAAKDLGHTSIAITDHGTLSSHREMQIAAVEQGLKPILGLEAYISPTDRFDKSSKTDKSVQAYNHIILLAKDENGLKNLNRLSEIAWTEGYYHKPRIDREILAEYKEGIIALSGCMNGLISKAIIREEYDEAKSLAKWFKDTFGEDFYMEVQPHNPQDLNKKLLELADAYGIKPVATADCHYAKAEDRATEEAMLILSTSPKINKDADFEASRKITNIFERLNYLYPERKISFQDINVYVSSREDMQKDFVEQGFDRTDMYDNSLEIANKIGSYEFRKGLDLLPVPKTNADNKLKELALNSMKEKGLTKELHGNDEYELRLDEELQIIKDKSFASYFLVVADMINFAKNKDIMVGPGRGSAAGSLVCYLLGITTVDPVKFDLLFFRFINPERNDFPDIDTDFEDRRRKEVKEYLRKKFKHVASISTFTYFKDKGVVRDAARVFGVPLSEVNKALKQVDTFEEFETSPNAFWFRERYPEVTELARSLRGKIRSVGMHAAGMVVAKDELVKFAPIETRSDKDDAVSGRIPVVAYDMDTVADIGLIKIDALGLKTLSVISDTLKMISDKYGKHIDLESLDLTDPAIYEDLSKGFTKGIFQAEATPYTNLLIKMGVSNFEDLAASNALVRPGAMNTVGHSYIARKKGEEDIVYQHQIMRQFTERTYGVIIYQEQVMQACVHLGGMSMSEADKVRKIIGKKKDAKEFDEFKERFIEGASKHIPTKTAEDLWHDFEAHSGYSFNRSHAIAYSLLSYWTAWLKHYYPLEFMFAILRNEHDKDARTEYLIEAKRLGIKILLPHVNESDLDFKIQKDAIRFGLSNIKFISDNIGQKLMEAGPFKSYKDLEEKAAIKGSGINSRALAALNSIGAAAFEDNPRTGKEAENLYEYLSIPKFDLARVSPHIKAQVTQLEDFEERGTFVMLAMVKGIKKGNGWSRIEMVDETGTIGVFHTEQTQIEVGNMYFFLVGDNRIHRYVTIDDVANRINDTFVTFLHSESLNIPDAMKMSVSLLPYRTKQGKSMGHLIMSNSSKELTRAIVFPQSYDKLKGRIKDGMIYIPEIGQTEDGTYSLRSVK